MGEHAGKLIRRITDKVFNENRYFENLNMNSMSFPEWIKLA